MELLLNRKWKKDSYTIGILYAEGERFSETVEDKDRGLKDSMSEAEIRTKKKYGITAIPTGTYEIKLSISPKFRTRVWGKKYNGLVPEITGVKGFLGVRIHPANRAEELLGCVAPGENKIKGGVINSVNTYYKLMDKYIMPAYNKGEKMTITIK